VTVLGHPMPWMWALANILATYRLARLVTVDTLLVRPREALIARARRRWPGRVVAGSLAPTPADLLVCAWCCSPWIAAGVIVLWRWLPAVWAPAAVVLAGSAVAGYLSERA
jgi:Protein of unknown function (DUF1360)